MFACPATDDFFRSRIDHTIDLRHPLAVLASRMPWQEIEARVAQGSPAKAAPVWPCPPWTSLANRCSVWPLPATPDAPACYCAS